MWLLVRNESVASAMTATPVPGLVMNTVPSGRACMVTALGFALLLTGVVLVIAEAHVPGGVLGVAGGLALIAGGIIVIGALGGGAALAVPIGIGLGVMGSVIVLILPDETKESHFQAERRMAREALRNARNRDPGYEVLDDEDD